MYSMDYPDLFVCSFMEKIIRPKRVKSNTIISGHADV